MFAEFISIKLFQNIKYVNLIKLSSVIILLTNINTLLTIVIRYMKKPMLFSIIIFIQVSLISFTSLVLVMYYKFGIEAMIYGQILGLFFSLFFSIIICRKYIIFNISKKEFMQSYRFALPIFPARMGSIANSHISKFFMLSYLPLSAIGIYSVALKLSGITGIIVSAFSLVWQPFMYENYKKENSSELFNIAFRSVVIISMFMTIVIALFSKEIIFLFLNEQYFDTHYLIGGIVMSNMYVIVKMTLDIGAQITKKTIYMSYQYFIVAVINIISLIIFIKIFKERGVVISLMITIIINILISLFITQKLYPMPYNKKLLFITILISTITVLITMFYDMKFIYKVIYFVLMIVLIYPSLKEITLFKYNIKE